MRKYIISVALLFLCVVILKANSTTTRGGSLTIYSSFNTCSIDARVLLTELPSTLDSAYIDWGDGMVEPIPLTGWSVSNVNGYYLISLNAIGHGYPFGSYTIYFSCGKRVPWIRNMLNSDTTTFTLSSLIVLNPAGPTYSSPISDSLILGVEMALLNVNSVSPLVMFFDTDSCNWNLVNPINAVGYMYPDISGGGNFILDPSQNFYQWNPQIPGLYTVAISSTKYAETSPGFWVVTGITTCEVLIDAGQVSSSLQFESNCSVNVFPNPSKDFITFQFSDYSTPHTVIITDQLGRKIWNRLIIGSQTVVDVHDFPAGMYFYRLEQNGIVVETGKLILE